METKHTPGPWYFHEQGDANNYCLMRNDKRWVIAFQQNGEIWKEEQLANATLIATAPELLEALQKAKEIIERISSEYSLIAHKHSSYTNGEARIIESAIKKATGDALEKTFEEAQRRFSETLKNLDDEKI